ncbi:TAXI family TRAP transporter solute-binding subunit [Magnetovibrio sp. PR-2]|uniref:TAXI family TRAP transporter solute-binding subunit n=1 Tax=Magnetovibrio sp. PR-2 TaxID=3120356 RepID=UPI002FCE0D0B
MNKDSLRIGFLSLVILLAGFVFAYQFVEPAPPKTITIASGGPTGAYNAFANRYAESLAAQGITLNVLETAGSIENIELLNSGKADVAFVQGGTGDAEASPNLVSLGALYYEPLWLFVNKKHKVKRLSDLKNLRVAAGAEGSGTWAVVRQLLEINNINTEDKRIRHLSSKEAVGALKDGKVDAAFFVTSPTSGVIQDLIKRKNFRLIDFSRASAYVHQHRYLSALTLYEGVIDLAKNVPAQNVTLLAPAATLAAHKDLHPALQTLLVKTASSIHTDGGIFEEPGAFPSTNFLDFPLSSDAKRYIENGPSFLERYLPFWAAVLVDRLKVMIIPLITLMIPLGKILPPAYRWRIRSRIYRWYKDLIRIEREVLAAESIIEKTQMMEQLDTMRNEVRELAVPLSYTDEVYNLRLHIDQVIRDLEEQR